MFETITQTTDVQLMVAAVQASPSDETAQCALADAAIDAGMDPEKASKRAAKLAQLAEANALLEGKGRKASRIRSALRRRVGATNRRGGTDGTVPVVVVAGKIRPRLVGHGSYYTTPSGAPVHHPNAYRSAWGKPVYHCSTRRVEVGAGWLLARAEKLSV